MEKFSWLLLMAAAQLFLRPQPTEKAPGQAQRRLYCGEGWDSLWEMGSEGPSVGLTSV